MRQKRTGCTLSQPKFSPDMKAKELLETIQSNAIKCFDYMKENNAILNELVFQRAPAELTSAEIASLQEFADKMFDYDSSEDCGIAYKVYSLLLENARLRGDKPAIVRYLYEKAVSLHYLNVRGIDYAINPYGTQVRGLFQEGASYIAEYESFDKTTKGYIMCCLGNSRMSMPRSTPEECTEYMKTRRWASSPTLTTTSSTRTFRGANSSMRCIWTGRRCWAICATTTTRWSPPR
jgi:hypothetical protein